MKFAEIKRIDVANGEGIRVSLFVTGCYFNCFKCFNPDLQNFEYGKIWTQEDTETVIEFLKPDYIDGLSILGGEPMEHASSLIDIITTIKPHLRHDQDIWLWSGYTFEEILLDMDKLTLLKEVDVLVDGQFKNDLKDLSLKFRGSKNQRVIDVKQSFENKTVVEVV